jgi:hypothetical protein
MMFRLGTSAAFPEADLRRLLTVAINLRAVDPRHSLPHLVRVFATRWREDSQALDAAARVCRAVFSPDNVLLAAPALSDLFREGALQQGLCAVDALLYGCAGGRPPGCL